VLPGRTTRRETRSSVLFVGAALQEQGHLSLRDLRLLEEKGRLGEGHKQFCLCAHRPFTSPLSLSRVRDCDLLLALAD
jgi:hypothetical protein